MWSLLEYFFETENVSEWYEDSFKDTILENRPVEDLIGVKRIVQENTELENKIYKLSLEWRDAEGYGKANSFSDKLKKLSKRIMKIVSPSISSQKIDRIKNEIKELENSRPDSWKAIVEPIIEQYKQRQISLFKNREFESNLYAQAHIGARIKDINKYLEHILIWYEIK